MDELREARLELLENALAALVEWAKQADQCIEWDRGAAGDLSETGGWSKEVKEAMAVVAARPGVVRPPEAMPLRNYYPTREEVMRNNPAV